MSIPFNRPAFLGREAEYLQQAIQEGHYSGDGRFTKACHELLQSSVGVPRALLTTSCTHALEMSALLLGIEPGDEVIIPSFTFVSTVNAFVLRGAKPVFCDIRRDTLNMDEGVLEGLVTERTRAIVPVHYAGVACEMDSIGSIAEAAGVAVVEDNAHALYGRYKGKQLGTFGAMATQSFHETKNFSCGEGGALLINDRNLLERAEIIREKGTNRSRFFRGQVDKYTWVDVGSSYLPSELLAAVLLGQLEARDDIQGRRQELWNRYDTDLAHWTDANDVRKPVVPAHCDSAYHMYYLLMPDLRTRQAFIAHLRDRDVLSVFHYLPLHLSDMGRGFGGMEGQCPVTEEMSDRLVRLPFFNTMTVEQQERVIDEILSFEVQS